MTKRIKTPEQERQDAHEIRKSFLIESIDIFIEDHDIFDIIRSIRSLRFKSGTFRNESLESVQKANSVLHGIESLLLDFVEANAKANILFLASYEQVSE